jgi:hypothetical protein
MNENRMTTEDTWQKHWSGRNYIQYVSKTYSYHDVINRISHQIPIGGSCIELGGFPGYFSIYFKKYCGFVPTLIDYYFDKKIFKDIIDFNGLSESDICCIKDDVFTHSPNNRYDLVASFGLIEHFTDLHGILRAHIKYMKPGATLLIGLPNFRGINGLLQKYFDPENLSIHNLDVMNLALIKNNLKDLGLLHVDVSYYPSTQVWIENISDRGVIINLIVRLVGKITKFSGLLFGKENKILSNSIIVTARAPE